MQLCNNAESSGQFVNLYRTYVKQRKESR